ncbi:hypothetical protein BDP67DRAFT_493980 [Colletotrichum lupini]|nr:hypothetical protein BDP67DRAFT_493980 [Colletotrichum lupini]
MVEISHLCTSWRLMLGVSWLLVVMINGSYCASDVPITTLLRASEDQQGLWLRATREHGQGQSPCASQTFNGDLPLGPSAIIATGKQYCCYRILPQITEGQSRMTHGFISTLSHLNVGEVFHGLLVGADYSLLPCQRHSTSTLSRSKLRKKNDENMFADVKHQMTEADESVHLAHEPDSRVFRLRRVPVPGMWPHGPPSLRRSVT